MKTRHVFSTPDLATARAAMDAARGAGVRDDDLLLIARSDIELEASPDDYKDADTDLMPAALRGAGYGGATGLLARPVRIGVIRAPNVDAALFDALSVAGVELAGVQG